ncbi:class I SAM-dependent methyltransferase [Streptantibioticus rubrisoli]|uniref:S-adenosyl-L-methionine-dependent methyltransferase n=1 Tax=Streptantibioticus rubrisoli TaxID=1387313 RepID=A0ABT1P811_9ACTN|nr:SAM-dependent methyltransferase [Streptantibioticus rubrisoli]MCQ4041492.1 SAM-dependent methyltransferase [Streptantibioticus rubrisoli]
MESVRQTMEPVSRTAQWTAAARALESERADRIFDDPYARTVAGDTGFDLLERYRGSAVVPFVLVRTRYMDDAVTATVRERGIRQVVLVAAGMDMRAVRLSWPPGVTLYEMDRPALLDAKAALLADHPSAPTAVGHCDRRTVPVDLAAGWQDQLLAEGFVPGQPTLWVAEGLFFFLPEDVVRRLLTGLRELSAPGSVLIGDMTSRATLTNPLARGFLRVLEDDGNPWLFGTDGPEEFLSSCGWAVNDLKQPGEDGADFGRWPHPVQPRSVPNVPRSFLFTAEVVPG